MGKPGPLRERLPSLQRASPAPPRLSGLEAGPSNPELTATRSRHGQSASRKERAEATEPVNDSSAARRSRPQPCRCPEPPVNAPLWKASGVPSRRASPRARLWPSGVSPLSPAPDPLSLRCWRHGQRAERGGREPPRRSERLRSVPHLPHGCSWWSRRPRWGDLSVP